MEHLLNVLKNWLLTIILIIGGIADLGFGLLNEFADDLQLDHKYIVWFRILIIAVGMIKLKLQPPSNNPDKLWNIAANAEVKNQ